uniref:Putative potassium-sodium transporter n=1 Tax=Mesembryanthemum crystallinum TaxID=3544 RepID=Q94KC8_MESCR|nr:putative potassium-sodium transporter [Mesembryanthemum crystallinum]
MEKYLALFHKKLDQFFNFCYTKALSYISSLYEYIIFQVHPFWHHLFYYIIVSLLGYFSLKATSRKQRSSPVFSDPRHDDLDLFFTSVSATTISSMSTIEMEDFSSPQLVVLIILMLSGGEVFLSLLGLQLRKSKHRKREQKNILLNSPSEGMKYKSLVALGHVVLGYLLVCHIIGYSLASLYISISRSASNVLERKHIEMHLFSLFVTVSTFSNCGFIPTNENMMVFKGNSGLLLILIPQILLGNKLYPSCLRLVLWVLEKLTGKAEFSYILKKNDELGYGLFFSQVDALLLAVTAVGLVMVQFVVFCILEWNSVALMDLNWHQKLVGSLFQTVNSRHSGESIIDLSLISPATMVLFVVMMYLPSYTTFIPVGYDKEISPEMSSKKSKKQGCSIAENLKFSQLSYLAIFVMIVCITERRNLVEDPLNFNVFNIIVEVISAYGNVGFSMGYSCKRRLGDIGTCKDAGYGFVGRWSRQGKMVIILVMLFGRLKRFNFKGGKAWKLSL